MQHVISDQDDMANYRSQQARLAKMLIDSLGLEGAISACRANGWDGVLEFLPGAGRDRTHGPTRPSARP